MNKNVTVQTMLKSSYENYSLGDLNNFKYKGCDILRFSIKDKFDENKLKSFISSSPLPLVIDIKNIKEHAIFAIKNGISAVRINPIFLTESDIYEIFTLCKEKNIYSRIGVNTGSVFNKTPFEVIEKGLNIAEKLNYKNIYLSIKSSSEEQTIFYTRELKNRYQCYKIHIGLTEAGDNITSTVRSTLVLSDLLKDGVGDTIRYSISGSEEDEIVAGVTLLDALNIKKQRLRLVICPSCSRATYLTSSLDKDIYNLLYKWTYLNNKYITFAVMGCALNGITEAQNADIGVSGNKDEIIVFAKGSIYKKTDKQNLKSAISEVLKEI